MRVCVSVSSKLLILLITSGVAAAITLSALSYVSADRALRDSIWDHLVAIRETKKAELLRYVDAQQRTFKVFASQEQLPQAMDAFRTAFAATASAPTTQAAQELADYYRKDFLPHVPGNSEATTLSDYLPGSNAGITLQAAYLASNPNPMGKKQLLGLNGEVVAGAGSYSPVHNRFHPLLVRAMSTMKLYDLFLIDHKTGDILYTAQKEADFGTNLETGPYRNSVLARAFRLARDNRLGDNGVVMVDFDHYAASFGEPSAFLAAPLIVNGELKGIVAGQLSIDAMNAALTSSGRWTSEGLGKTGEVYLVGPDGTARSDSRFLIEDKPGYLALLARLHVAPATRDAIEASGHSILNQKFQTVATTQALAGVVGQGVIDDYRGEAVLSAYAPLEIAGMRWGIIAEKDVAEAMEPLYTLRRHIFLATGIIAILITLFSMFASRFFLGPIARLQAGVERLKAGETQFAIPIKGTDEFEELGMAFNEMLAELAQRNQIIAAKTVEYEKLLRNILPDAVADRVSGGELMVADTYENVGIVYASILGLSSIMTRTSARESIGMMNELIDAFDEAAERHGVEKIKTVGDVYLAACGLSTPRLDYRQRIRAFADEMLAILQRFNDAKGYALTLQVGLANGEVDAGIVGRKRFVYEILGECVVEARRLALTDGHPGVHMSAAMTAELAQ